jgi:hypothetical protein
MCRALVLAVASVSVSSPFFLQQVSGTIKALVPDLSDEVGANAAVTITDKVTDLTSLC